MVNRKKDLYTPISPHRQGGRLLWLVCFLLDDPLEYHFPWRFFEPLTWCSRALRRTLRRIFWTNWTHTVKRHRWSVWGYPQITSEVRGEAQAQENYDKSSQGHAGTQHTCVVFYISPALGDIYIKDKWSFSALFKSSLVVIVCLRFYLKTFFLDRYRTWYNKFMGTQNRTFFSLDGHRTRY